MWILNIKFNFDSSSDGFCLPAEISVYGYHYRLLLKDHIGVWVGLQLKQGLKQQQQQYHADSQLLHMKQISM